MKKIVTIIIIVGFFSCKKDNVTSVDEVVKDVKESTEIVAKEGSGKIILKCNGKEFVAEGVCGALVTMGELIIAVKDKTNPAKVFMISFNDDKFPKDGMVYKIKSKDYTQEGNGPDDEVTVNFTEGLPNNKMNIWDSENAKGTLKFEYNGNEINCRFTDIVLTAGAMFNAEDLKADGVISGELTFYKN